MRWFAYLIRSLAFMLFIVFGASMAFAVPTATVGITYFQTQPTHIVQADDVGFAAGAPPLAVTNIATTGDITVMRGSAFALHGQETVAVLFGFGADLNATNSADEVVTGARTLSRMDAEGWDLAEDFYEQMRRSGGSVDEIAQNTGLSKGAVERAYRHLFLDRHQLDDGLKRFDADPEIVNAWNRMRNGTHTTADIDLVNHERFEAILMQRYGQPYRCAHATANACGFQSPIDN